jgi:glycosyltransferase involved in cell wall biosynthesis
MDDKNTHTPLVSVIMPTFNYAEFIGESIGSVLGQTYTDLELIVVDNHSTDDTEKIVAAHIVRDPRVRYTKIRNNGIIAFSRNKGIKMARGKFLAFIDSDDTWLPGKLKKQVCFLEDNQDIFMTYAKVYVQKHGKVLSVSPSVMKAGRVFNDLYLAYNFINTVTVMMRNRKGRGQYLFDEDEDLVIAEDYDLWLRIAYREKISFIDNEPLASYRLHDRNAHSGIELFFKRVKYIMKKFSHLVPMNILIRKYVSYYTKMCVTYVRLALRPVYCFVTGKKGLFNAR